MLVGYRAFLYGSVVSVDWQNNKNAKAFLPFWTHHWSWSLCLKFVWTALYEVQPAYSGTPMTRVCPRCRQVSTKHRFFCIQCIYHEWVVVTSALYSASPAFTSQPVYWVLWMNYFVIFVIPSRPNIRITYHIRSLQLPSTSFPSLLLPASQDTPQINN